MGIQNQQLASVVGTDMLEYKIPRKFLLNLRAECSPVCAVSFRFAKSKFSEKCQEEKLLEIATFINRVMLPRLGESFIQPVAVVELPQDQLQVRLSARSTQTVDGGNGSTDPDYFDGFLSTPYPTSIFSDFLGSEQSNWTHTKN